MFPVLATGTATPYLVPVIAQVAELADALGSGPSGSNLVQVRFLSWAMVYGNFAAVKTIVSAKRLAGFQRAFCVGAASNRLVVPCMTEFMKWKQRPAEDC